MESKISAAVEAALQASTETAAELPALASQAAAAAGLIARCIATGGKVICFGNGGSASDAEHFSTELVCRFAREREALPALALTSDSSALTAIANDLGFEQVFSRQLEAHAKAGDVAIAITTSGRSPNVLAGVATARRLKLGLIVMTGTGGGALADSADVAIVSTMSQTARIQESHGAVIHAICGAVEGALAGAAIPRSRQGEVTTLADLVILRQHYQACGCVVVWTNGVFDLLHVGHLNTLRAARAFGDVLFVGVNDDAAVRRLKGSPRPLTPAVERAELVAALEPVDRVILFAEDTPEECLRALRPDIHVKGDDYRPPNGKAIPELATVLEYGGRVEFVERVPERSTSRLVDALGS